MKTNVLFQGLLRAFLMVVIIVMVGGFVALPNHTVSAKPLAAAFIDCASQTEIPVAECDVLTALYNSTDGANWNDSTGWLQTDTPCSWFGVSCVDGHVTQLQMNSNNLSGAIPGQLVNLTDLTELDLGDNQLSGSIPTELGGLTNLTVLNLNSNQLTGPIPAQLGNLTNLTLLTLGGNQLSGSIPTQLGNLTNLVELDLTYSQLSGSIPTELGNLTNLTKLSLGDSQLTGSIPTQLGSLTNLTKLYLGWNQLSGSIPTQLGSLTKLTNLTLGDNQLTGSIPIQLGSLTNLTYLLLTNNKLTGSIPTELGNLTRLTHLGLGNNQLSSSIPTQLGNLAQLQYLYLSGNQLSGSIPTELSSLANLNYLYLDNNQLTGPIPTELGNLTNLYYLSLDSNQLTGSIPIELGSLTNLLWLYLNSNQLTGSIPTELGNLTQLAYLHLNGNQLSGEIPASFINLTSLEELALGCGLTSSNPAVIAFLNEKNVDWSCANTSGNPNFSARFPENEVHGYDWPLGASVTISIDDPDNGVGEDYSDMQTAIEAPWGSNQAWVQFSLESFQLKPGQTITMTDGITTKSHTIHMAVTGLNVDTDIVSGTAEPDSVFQVSIDDGPYCDVTANVSGEWTVDFAAGIGCVSTFDIRPGTNGEAYQSDDDGDATIIQWHILNPHIEASPSSNSVHAHDWPNGTPVTLTIDDPSNGVGIDKTAHAIMGPASWDPNDIRADFNLNGFDLQTGDILSVTDGTTERTYALSNIAITGFDIDTDIVSGMAEPGSALQVDINGGPDCDVTANVSGEWAANFATGIGCGFTFDVRPDTSGEVRQSDANGNQTYADWHVLNPYIQANTGSNWVRAYDWLDGTPLTLTINDMQSFNVTMGPGLRVQFDLGSYDLQPGDKLFITDEGTPPTSREYHPVDLAVTGLDVDANTVWGTTGAADGQVHIWVQGEGGPDLWVPVTDGHWTANFSPYDLVPGVEGDVEYSDPNGNRTYTDWHVPNPRIEAGPDSNWVRARDWPNGMLLTLTIDDPSNGVGLDKTTHATAGPDAGDINNIRADFNLGGFDLQPGQILNVTDGTTERTYTISNLAITAIDLDADTISGIATPGVEVQVCANVLNFCVSRHVTPAAETGIWTVDYGHIGATPGDEPQFVDLQPGNNGWANQRDANGNSTGIGWHVPNPHFSVYLSKHEIQGSDWPLGATITLTVDDLADGIGVNYTDTTTVIPYYWDHNQTLAYFNVDPFEFKPGQIVTLTDGTTARTHIINDLGVSAVDPNAETVSGTAVPGSQVEIERLCNGNECALRRVTTAPNGNWLADFSSPGEDDDEKGIADISPGISSEAKQSDESGNATIVTWRMPNPSVDAWLPDNKVCGSEWAQGAQITLTINDPNTSQTVDYTDILLIIDKNEDDSSQTRVCFALNGFVLEAGHIVSLTDGAITKTTTVTSSRVTFVDTETDTLSGVAAPSSDVWVWVDDPSILINPLRHMVADANGHWTVDFSVPGGFVSIPEETDWPDTQALFDIRLDTTGGVGQAFGEGSTQVSWCANNPPVITEGASTSVAMSQNDPSHPFHLTLHATDADGDTLTWSISAPAGHGAASAGGVGASKNISYTPNTNYFGPDAFVVQVADGKGGKDTITVHVTISGAVVLALLPAAPTLNVGQAFNLTVQVQAGAQQVDGAAAYLNFDPAYFQVVSMSSGATLPVVIQNAYDNTTGAIDYAAGVLGASRPSGSFTLVTIRFMARAPSPGAALTFSDTLPRKSDASFGGYSAMNHAENGMVVITNFATLNGQIALQGRPAAPDPRWVTALTVSLTVPGESAPRYTFTPSTDGSGRFSIGSIPPGTYEARVKNSHALQNKLTVTLANGDNAIDFGILREGDANNDNFVSLVDFSILASSFGKCQGASGYDDRADFNEDGCVSLLDFSLLSTNFGQAGAAAMQTQALNPIAGNVQLAIAPATVKVVSGQVFSMTVQVKAGTQGVDAAQASLDFNPALLRVRRLTAGTALPLSLQNNFDNSAGTIDFAAGTLSNFPSGTFTLVTVEFEALMPTTGADLAFHFGLPRDAGVTFAGKSVLGQTNGGRVFVTLPITATFASNARNDGWILESSENSSKGGSLNSAAAFFILGDDAANKQYRSLLHFDTSSLPDNAVITSVALKIKSQKLVGANPFSTHGALLVDLRKPFFGATAGLELGDFRAGAGKLAAAAFGAASVSNWYSAVIGSAGYAFINLSGPTQFRLRFTKDDDNDHVADYMQFYSGNAPAANHPQLVISYYVP